jgi:adenylylsulfate kinase
MSSSSSDAIFPTAHLLRTRVERQAHLRQRSVAVWLFGLSGAGKTTLADALDRRLAQDGHFAAVLDGDNLRGGLNSGLGFSDPDRFENIRRAAEVARLFVQAGVIAITALITPRRGLRDLVRSVIGPEDLIEVYLSASFDVCARRDPKGLYARAAAGEISAFTGRDSAFEPPEHADLVLDTGVLTPAECLARVHAVVEPRIRL